MADDLLNIDLGFKVGFEVSIHPLVPLQILDLFYRKNASGYIKGTQDDRTPRVAGSLMGIVYTNRIHITSCFAVNDEEDSDENVYTLDFNEHRNNFNTHIHSNPNEVLLGAFVTDDLTLDINVAYLSQEYGKKENYFFSTALLVQPVILKIDPSFKDGEVKMKAFRLNQSLKEYCGVASFNVLPVKVEFLDESYQQVAPFLVREDGQTNNNFKIVDSDNVQHILAQASKNISILESYIKRIINGEVAGNEELGRNLLNYLNKLQLLQSENFIKEYQIQSQEAQLAQYLSNLALGQTLIGEKLAKI